MIFAGFHWRNFISTRESPSHSAELDAEDHEDQELGAVRVDRHGIDVVAHQHQPVVQQERRGFAEHSQGKQPRPGRRQSGGDFGRVQPEISI